MAVVRPPDAVAIWYRPDSLGNSIDASAAVWADAVYVFEQELTNDERKREWIRGHTSMADVCHVLEQAKRLYRDGSGKEKKAREWVNVVASRVMYYGSVLDVLSQYDPGHAGLVWGAMKFLFSGVLNHAELVAEISKAFTRIADVLPRVQLDGMLYNIPQMRSAISKLYAHIILFLQKAVRWYTKHPLLRLASVILTPFKLGYQDTVQQITLCAESVTAIANSAVRAETRGLTMEMEHQAEKLRDLDVQLRAMQQQQTAAFQRTEAHAVQMIQIATSHFNLSQAIKLDVTDSKVRICDLQFSQILSILRSNREPEDVLQICQSVARRRLSWRSQAKSSATFIQRLGGWVSISGSSMFIVVAGPRAEARAKDFAVEVTGLLQATSFPVIYHFSEPIASDKATSLTRICQSLLLQAFRKNPEIFSQDFSLANAAKYQTEHSLDEWLNLVCLVYAKIPKCFLVIETEDFYRVSGRDATAARHILQTFQRILDNVTSTGCVMKLLIVTYGRAGAAPMLSPMSPAAPPHIVANIGQILPASQRLKRHASRRPRLALELARYRLQPILTTARQTSLSSHQAIT